MRGTVKDGVYTKLEKESGKLRMSGGSWSINLQDIDLNQIHKIVYQTEKSTYTISAQDAERHGWRTKLGGELKLVVPLKYWENK